MTCWLTVEDGRLDPHSRFYKGTITYAVFISFPFLATTNKNSSREFTAFFRMFTEEIKPPVCVGSKFKCFMMQAHEAQRSRMALPKRYHVWCVKATTSDRLENAVAETLLTSKYCLGCQKKSGLENVWLTGRITVSSRSPESGWSDTCDPKGIFS